MGAAQRAARSIFSFIPPNIRPQTTDLSAGVFWGGTVVLGAFWLIQPFDWVKEQFSKSEETASS
ncbi:hypothetical protein KP509_05G022500 [Ceratopteris richardii]|uniref:Uncharacterized protein n=1 Tax=Ceratopteris richardii TaxID=49495 RepID=A0A8T2USD0_CERRI|nr:hypothetical protein KP509_05G022500 [Ceratopteris richardii]